MSRLDPVLIDGWFGSFLNFYCAGLAQLLYKESRKRGLIILSLYWAGLMCSIAYVCFLIYGEGTVWNQSSVWLLVIMVFATFCLWAVSLIDAYRLYSGHLPRSRKGGKSVGFGLFLTVLLPSAGHFYLGQIAKAILCLLLFVGLIILFGSVGALASNHMYKFIACAEPVIWVTFFFWMFQDILNFKKKQSYGQVEPQAHFFVGRFKKVLLVVGVLLFLVYVPHQEIVTRYFLSTFRVASPSMEPTIHEGEWVFVEHISEPHTQLKHGDIGVFELPGREEKMAKRILGLPGDVLSFTREKAILVNGIPFKWQRASTRWPKEFDGREITVPSGQVFVIGDNAQYSFDSFQFGPIPFQSIRGRVLKVFYPLKR